MTWSDLSTEDYNLHPGIKKTVRGLKIGLALITLAIFCVVAGGLYFLNLYTSGQKLAWVPALLTMVMVLPLGYLHYFLSRKYVPKLVRAAEVMRSVTPETLDIKSLGFADFSGSYVELRRPHSDPAAPPLGIAAVNAGKGKVLPRQSTSATVYLEHGSLDRYLVIEHGKNIFWGQMTTRDSRERGLRQFRKLTSALVALFLLMTLGLIAVQLFQLQQTRQTLALSEQSEHWPRTPGVITSSKVVGARISRGKGTVPGFRAAIQYTYAVDGQEFKGGLIHIWYHPTTDQQDAARLVKTYPEGSHVEVAYNPDDPALAVLETGHLEEGRQELRKNTRAMMVISAASVLSMVVVAGILIYTGRRGANTLRQYPDLD